MIWWGRTWVDNHPKSELLAEYLYSGPWVTGLWLVPKRLNRKKLITERQELYEGFLRLGQEVPEEYAPGKWWEEGLLEYRLAYRRAVRNVEKKAQEKTVERMFNPQVLVAQQKGIGEDKVGRDGNH